MHYTGEPRLADRKRQKPAYPEPKIITSWGFFPTSELETQNIPHHLKVFPGPEAPDLDHVQDGPQLVQVVLNQGARQADEYVGLVHLLCRQSPGSQQVRRELFVIAGHPQDCGLLATMHGYLFCKKKPERPGCWREGNTQKREWLIQGTLPKKHTYMCVAAYMVWEYTL